MTWESDSGESILSSSPSEWPNWPKGSMPYSLRLPEACLYRYQNKKYLDLGQTWYRMIWDLEHKWVAAQRYSAKELAPGHFFSVSPAGARAEMNAYRQNLNDFELLEFTVSIDNLLDLTNTDALTWFYKKHFDAGSDWHWGVILDSLFDQQLGGDAHTTFAGHMALRDEYNGIVFFGARAVQDWWTDPGSMSHRDWDLCYMYHQGMRADEACINVLIYFAHNVVRSTHRIKSPDRVVENALFDASMAEIDEVFRADPARPPDSDLSFEYERARAQRILWVSKPGIIEETSGG